MKTTNITIGTKSFTLNCPEGQEELLEKMTLLLDRRYDEIRKNAPNLPYDQSLALAALNTLVSQHNRLEDMESKEHSIENRLKRIIASFDNMVYATTED